MRIGENAERDRGRSTLADESRSGSSRQGTHLVGRGGGDELVRELGLVGRVNNLCAEHVSLRYDVMQRDD